MEFNENNDDPYDGAKFNSLFTFQLQGEVDDCSCNIEHIDAFNNGKIFPILNSLLQKDYFRYWKVVDKKFRLLVVFSNFLISIHWETLSSNYIS